MKTLVIIPTYNETENIRSIVPAIFGFCPQVNVLVVDDSSPDGTGAVVEEMSKSDARIFLLSRPGKSGLGRAYVAGFDWGLSRGYDLLVEMDADFSHRPQDLKLLIQAAENGADFAIGSRYVRGGRTVNWGLGRKLISRGGSVYSGLVLGYGLSDWTGGFNAWNRRVLEKIGPANIHSEGYSFQVELKYRALRKGFSVREVPIVFEDRRVGQSKMSGNIVIEAVWRVLKMRMQ